MNDNILSFSDIIYVILLFFIIYFIIKLIDWTNYKKSNIDNKEYYVHDYPNKIQAANLLALLKKNCIKLNEILMKDIKPDTEFYEYILRLNDRIYDCEFRENSLDNENTSYNLNKGDMIIFCLRNKQNESELYDINFLMYVAIHEIAHIACPEQGHTDLFNKINKHFVGKAIEHKLYNKIDFNKKPMNYCGLIIKNSVI